MNIINTMYSGMVEGLVKGDLMERYFNDLEFQKAIDVHHPLLKAPGHYVQAYVLKQYIQEPITTSSPNTQATQAVYRKKQENAGRQVTGRKLAILYNRARKYYWGGDLYDPKFAKELDESVQGNGAPRPLSDYQSKVPGTHRFCPTKDSAARQYDWLTAMWNNSVEKMSDLLKEEKRAGERNFFLDEYISFILFEIGYSTDVKSRADAHSNWHSSNKIFTFWQCLIRFFFDKDGQRYEVKRFMTNRLPRVQDAHGDACTADVGLTVMAHSHWFEGGMNPDPGAGGGVQAIPLHPHGKNKQWLESNFEWVYRQQGEYQYNLRKDQLKLEACRELDKRYQNRHAERAKQKEDRAELKRHEGYWTETSIPDLQGISKLLRVREQIDKFRERRSFAESPVPDLLADEETSSQPLSSQLPFASTRQGPAKGPAGLPAVTVVDTQGSQEEEESSPAGVYGWRQFRTRSRTRF